jgi:glutamyl-tRNA synthetase
MAGGGGSLIVSFKASPFPYAAVAIASYTNKVQVDYDESASGLIFTYEGTQITTEEDVVKALAKAGGLAEDSIKVYTSPIILSPI